MTDAPTQTMFITGGSKGLGARLVKESVTAGYNVAFTFVDDEVSANEIIAEMKSADPDRHVAAYRLDVRDSTQVEFVVEKAIDEFETIDTVVCNAGITRTSLMFSMSDEDWKDVIETNLFGAFFVCREFLGHFISNKFGRFVHISSIAMHGMAGQVGYCASKAGMMGLSNAIAKEYGAKGITSNTIALGLLGGGMTDNFASPQVIEHWEKFSPIGRVGDFSDAVHAVHFLADRKSGFINGTVLHVAGGLNVAP